VISKSQPFPVKELLSTEKVVKFSLKKQSFFCKIAIQGIPRFI